MATASIVDTIPRRARLTVPTLARHVLNLLPMIVVHIGAAAILLLDTDWVDWLLLPVFIYFRGIFITVGYHRFFSHRCFKTSRVMQFIIGFFCCGNLQQGPLWWAVYHRHHHKHSDDKGDPHSPYHGGFWWAYCGWLFIPLDPEWRTVNDLRRFPELVWLERFWQVPGILLAAVCWWVGGWNLLCVGFCLSAVISFHMTFVINTVGHMVGSQRYPTHDHSRNSFLMALFSMGDGWHNNHHQFPHAAHAGLLWWEIDSSFRVICLLERLGLVWAVRRVPPEKLLSPTKSDSEVTAESAEASL
jgi:stearoyl-CoA desaturase (delta-9 desaturase)